MATRDQLEQALRNAHAAGDAEAAQRFAQAIGSGAFENNEGDKVVDRASPEYATKVRSDFNNLGALSQLGVAADDVARIAADSLTMGYADKLLGGDAERAKTEDARIRAGSAGVATDIGSSILGFGKAPSLVGALRTGIPAAVTKGRGAIAATLGGAGEGAAYGTVSASGHDKDVVEGAKEGALFGVLGQGVAKVVNNGLTKMEGGIDAVTQAFKGGSKRSVTGTGTGKFDDLIGSLETAKNKAYDAADTLGIWFSPAASYKVADDVVGQANSFRGGYNEQASPRVHGTVKQLEKMLLDPDSTAMGKQSSLQTIEDARGLIRDNLMGPRAEPLDAAFGRRMLSQLDDSVEGILANPTGAGSSATAVSGVPRVLHSPSTDPTEAVSILKEARDLNSRMRKMQQVDEAMGGAERRASRSSATGEEATIRSKLDAMLGNKSSRRGFTEDELSAMDELVRGTTLMNLGHQAGRMAPGGGLHYTGVGVGGGIGALLGKDPTTAAIGAAIPPTIGILGNRVANNIAQGKADSLMQLIAAGGKKSNMPEPNTALPPELQDAIGRYVMMYGAK